MERVRERRGKIKERRERGDRQRKGAGCEWNTGGAILMTEAKPGRERSDRADEKGREKVQIEFRCLFTR